jgi:3-phenylpropionate/cinnamic acid dioxygenase small subunit
MPDVERVAAELEIRNVIARLAQLADTGEVDEYVAQFTDDAAWEMPDNERLGIPGSVRTGRDQIRAGVHERRDAGIQGPGSDTLHSITTTSVRLDGADAARAHSYFQFVIHTATAPTLQNMGQYDDTFRRTPDGWKLARRVITFG